MDGHALPDAQRLHTIIPIMTTDGHALPDAGHLHTIIPITITTVQLTGMIMITRIIEENRTIVILLLITHILMAVASSTGTATTTTTTTTTIPGKLFYAGKDRDRNWRTRREHKILGMLAEIPAKCGKEAVPEMRRVTSLLFILAASLPLLPYYNEDIIKEKEGKSCIGALKITFKEANCTIYYDKGYYCYLDNSQRFVHIDRPFC
jgi:hypothetical protein